MYRVISLFSWYGGWGGGEEGGGGPLLLQPVEFKRLPCPMSLSFWFPH